MNVFLRNRVHQLDVYMYTCIGIFVFIILVASIRFVKHSISLGKKRQVKKESNESSHEVVSLV
jgi:hypothetical protein